MTDELVTLAARNNAEWCDAVCRANGKGGVFRDALWINQHGTPRFYPDAVTLAGKKMTGDILPLVSDAIAAQPQRAWAVKDSFAELDLTALNFTPFFEATWICRDPSAKGHVLNEVTARIVRTEAELAAWSKAWVGDDASIVSLPFKPILLQDPSILFVRVERLGIPIGGGVLSRSAGAVGLSNVFTDPGYEDLAWQALAACATRHNPSMPLVGYERGNDLDAACRNGFRPIGTLRVWVRSA
ncbi:hypothetical protein [Microvirga solisilvae]|uniref:hypothetical protein n=1 Tax=Microvirga solisilvae TaxID=2919498 RepID=UPI001FAFB62F|nr:hypothetical protein [Microvirga solisilvae]